MPWRLSSEVLRERWGIRGQGGRQLAVQFGEFGARPGRVVVAARSACGGRLGAPGLGGQAQGYHRRLGPSGGWQHDEGLDPGLPESPVAAGAGTARCRPSCPGRLAAPRA